MTIRISAVMLTLNEAENIERTLDSASETFAELVLVDGGSEDGTVSVARDWCENNGKEFAVVESSEREYLLGGVGEQRTQGDRAAKYDYTMALDADVDVEVKNPEFFQAPYNHTAYVHTRVRDSGDVERDYRLYDSEYYKLSWRGLVHEEIQSADGVHAAGVASPAEAPMVHRNREPTSMNTQAARGSYLRRYSDAFEPGDVPRTLRKQHYLLKRAMDNDIQWSYLSEPWRNYYHANKDIVLRDWYSIHQEFNLPFFTRGHDWEEEADKQIAGWMDDDFKSGEPVMDSDYSTARGYVFRKLKEKVGVN